MSTSKSRKRWNSTLKGRRSFVLENTSNLPFLAQEPQKIYKKIALSIVKSCLILLGEHVEKISKNLTLQIMRL